jgi:hypothetical protein
MRPRLTLGLMLLWAGVPAVAAPPTFSEQRVLSSQADLCFDVRTEDLDADGDLDVLSASYDGLIAWWENDGADPPGPWAKHAITVFADGAHSAFAAHVDADADLDVWTATFNGAEVVWFENGSLPDPWREHEVSFDAPFASDIWAADLDGDGDSDAIVNHDGYVDWYEHDGAPVPQAWVKHVVAPAPSGGLQVEAADLDRDGDLDLVSGPWFENDGAPDPSFAQRPVSTFPIGQAANSVHVKDVDRDGDLDIVSAEDNRIAWHENDGGAPPSWRSHAISTTPDMALSVHAADLDGDTDVDVLHASFMDDTVAWHESDGGTPPSFTAHTITTGAWGARSVFAADLEGDGDVDVLSGTQRDHDIVWYVNESDHADTDGDGMRDDLDCAAGDASAFAVPRAIRGLRFDGAGALAWTPEAPRSGPGTVYDVLRGLLGELPVGSGAGETCEARGTPDTSLPPGTAPAPGTGFYYVVRGKNACGVGTYGLASGGPERTSAACP